MVGIANILRLNGGGISMEVDPSILAQFIENLQQTPRNDEPKLGNSRAFRKSRADGSSNSPVPQGIMHTMNPAMPLRFEMKEGWACNEFVAGEAQDIPKYFEHDYINPAVFQAHMAALKAYSLPSPSSAASSARAALCVSDLCPEAYNVLAAAAANSYEEALELYRKGVELGPKVLKSGLWEDAVAEAQMWLKGPYRPYYRALYGVANTLRKMKRYTESLEVYDQLMKVDPNWYWYSSYTNIHATYPLVLLEAKGPQAAKEWFMTNDKVSDQFTYISSSLYYAATYALVELELSSATGHHIGKEGAAVSADDHWAADGLDLAHYTDGTSLWEAAKSGLSLMVLCMHYPDAVDMLLGDKAGASSGMVSMTTGGPAGLQVAQAYVYTAGHHWRSRPVALQRLRRYRNTMELQCLVRDLSYRLPVSLSDIKHYLTAPGGFHKNALGRAQDGCQSVYNLVEWLCGAHDGKEFDSKQLKVLKWLLDAGCPVNNTHRDRPGDSALHMACYQGYGPECVKMLVAAGGDVYAVSRDNMTPMEMTANQGNWRELQALFTVHPELKTCDMTRLQMWPPGLSAFARQVKMPEALLLLLYESSCLLCLDGGEKCRRCSFGVPHSKHADFFKYAEVVIEECGLTELNRHTVAQMEKAVQRNGRGSVWGKLHKHIMKCIAAAAAAANVTKNAAEAAAGSSAGTLRGSSILDNASGAHKAAGAEARAEAKASRKPASAAAAAGSSADRLSGSNASNNASLPPGAAAAARARAVTPESGSTRSDTPAKKPQSDTNMKKLKRQQQCEVFCWGCAGAAATAATAAAYGSSELLRCGGCRKARYCSKECQKKDWQRHKVQCKLWTAGKENVG